MKKILAIGTFFALSTPLNAGSFYVTLSGGIQSPNTIDISQIDGPGEASINVDSSFGGEFGIGYDFENTIRTDITYSISKHDASVFAGEGDIDFSSIFLNIYKDFKIDNSKLTPYIGAGIGSSEVDFDFGSDSAFSYQVKVGSSYSVSKKSNLFLEAAYQDISDLTYPAASATADPSTMSYKAGFRYTFN